MGEITENGEIGTEQIGELDLTKASVIEKPQICQLKWRLLILICFMRFGAYFIYDFPGSIGTDGAHTIQQRFTDHNKEYTQTMNQALYSVYSYPNVVLSLVGGFMIDQALGIHKATMLFSTLVTVGAFVFWLGTLTVNYPLMVVGRLIFASGGDALSVAQSAFCARWFTKGWGLAFACAFTVCVGRGGTVFNFMLSPLISSAYGVEYATLTGAIVCGVSSLLAVSLIAIDLRQVRQGDPTIWVSTQPQERKLNLWKHIKAVPKVMILVAVVGVCFYSALFPFIGIAKNFFRVKYNLSSEEADRYVAVEQIVCAVASVITGALVDYTGRFTQWLTAAATLLITVFFLFIVAPIPAPVMMTLLGISYAMMVSSLYPCVPYVVDTDVVGFSFALINSMSDVGQATVPLITGPILDHYTPAGIDTLPSETGFRIVLIVFLTISVLALPFIWLLNIADTRHILKSSVSGRKRAAVVAAESVDECSRLNTSESVIHEM